MDLQKIDRELRFASKECGFIDIGVIPVPLLEKESEFLEKWTDNSFNGSMAYLERNMDVRRNPGLLLDGAASIIVLLSSYKHKSTTGGQSPKIASYAHGADYHKVLKSKMHELSKVLISHNKEVRYRVFTDSAPIFERSLAVRSGLGFVGKNTFLISPLHGLHTFISVIITDMKLLYNNNNRVTENLCGDCRRCIDACPSGAITDHFILDSRRCISYNTIENRDVDDFSGNIIACSDYIFGCDICMDACPWARKGDLTDMSDFWPLLLPDSRDICAISSREWRDMDSSFFNSFFAESPLKRAGSDKIKINLEYAMADNSGEGLPEKEN